MSPDVEIGNLLYRYTESVDQGDLQSVAAMFSHGEIVDGLSGGVIPGEQVLEVYSGFLQIHEDGTPCTRHITTNVIFNIDDASGIANTRSSFAVFQAREDFPLQPILIGRYHDQFERIDGLWRFRQRKIFSDLMGDLSQHLKLSLPH